MLTTVSFGTVRLLCFGGRGVGGHPCALWVKMCRCACIHSSSPVSLCWRKKTRELLSLPKSITIHLLRALKVSGNFVAPMSQAWAYAILLLWVGGVFMGCLLGALYLYHVSWKLVIWSKNWNWTHTDNLMISKVHFISFLRSSIFCNQHNLTKSSETVGHVSMEWIFNFL